MARAVSVKTLTLAGFDPPFEARAQMIDRIDHFVLTAADIEATCDFYSGALGFKVESFGQGRKALVFGRQKINLHKAEHEFDPKARRSVSGSADFCLITEHPLEVVTAQLRTKGILIEEGPVSRTGAMGQIQSIYFRDPDGNLVEVARY